MKRCAWISRHSPTFEQRVSLEAFQIVQVNPPGRLWSAADAVALSQSACQGWPDLYVVVMPMLLLQNFVERVQGHVPIVRAVMDSRSNRWTGHWEKIAAIHIVTEEWVPSRKESR